MAIGGEEHHPGNEPSRQPQLSSPPPSFLGYKDVKKIGQGSYGEVFRATDIRTGEIMAIKKAARILPNFRELQCLSSLPPHFAIVKFIKDVTCTDEVDHQCRPLCFAMEYIPQDLGLVLRSRSEPFCEAQAQLLMYDILHGVQHLHSVGIIHHDLKPSNLLAITQGGIKICDFGLCRSFKSGQPVRYHHIVGTLWYQAPELLLHCSEYTEAIDMWSVGCIFMEILQKEPFIQGWDEDDQLEKIRSGNHIIRPTISLECFHLLQRLLAIDPAKRITAAEALMHPWFSCDF